MAGSATWGSAPNSGIWNVAANWTPFTVPNGPNDIATFGEASTRLLSIISDVEVNAMVFKPAINAFGITPEAGVMLTLSGAGIVNETNNLQNIVMLTNDSTSVPDALIRFTNGASAGKSVYYYSRNQIGETGGSGISFWDHATADQAHFRIDGAQNALSSISQIDFNDQSTAGNATFYCNPGQDSSAPGGVLQFHDNATAGQALMYVNGGLFSSGGRAGNVRFTGGTAGDATLMISGGQSQNAEGGFVVFSPGSTAGNATLTVLRQGGKPGWIELSGEGGTCRIGLVEGFLDVSGHDGSPLTIGSLAGEGNVFLGSVNLHIGSNDLSTEYLGVVKDGDRNGAGSGGGSLTKIGMGTLTLSGANLYTGGTTVENGRLLVNNATGSATGSGVVKVNAGALLGGNGAIGGSITIQPNALLSPGLVATASGALNVSGNVTLHPGSVIELGLGTSGAHTSFTRMSGTWTFASNQTFSVGTSGAQPGVYENVITGLAGDPGTTGSWTINTAGFTGTFAYDGAGNIDLTLLSAAQPTPTPAPTATPAPTPSATPSPPPTGPPALVANVSTRLPVGRGDDVLIQGFIVQGSQGTSKKILVRAIGPSLSAFGIADALENPTLEVRDGNNVVVATNNDWKTTQAGGIITGDQFAEISGSGLAPSDDRESAIIADLAPGNYTAVVRGAGDMTGTGVVDAYDMSPNSPARLANIATRGLVQPGDKLMIAGFIIQNAPVKAAVRAIGPSLIQFGITNALPDTTLELRDQNGAVLLENDDWKTDPAQKQELETNNLQPSHDQEAALITTIPPGQYTAQVRGKNDATGIGVVQVYFPQ